MKQPEEKRVRTIWFKRKTYGWGWTPSAWQGWLITLMYVVSIVACSSMINESSEPRELLFRFILPLILFSLIFIGIAWKTGEKPQWQWGPTKDEEENG